MKSSLAQKEHISKSISRFIDNSIKAKRKTITNVNPCKITIEICNDFIEIEDNSGGISIDVTEEELFKIDFDSRNGIGLGIKKSFFSLGKIINIFSNKREGSRKFSLDTTIDGEELVSQCKNINYNTNKEDGTKITIRNLNKNIKKEIENNKDKNIFKEELGRIYRKFIEKKEVIILVNGERVKSKKINGRKLSSRIILDNYKVFLYKAKKKDISGVEIFINDYMKYSREEGKKEINWNRLRQPTYTYGDCIVEVQYYGDESKYEKNKVLFYEELIGFIKESKENFKSKTITIQYEADIGMVEELKAYYNETTAKGVGKKAFYKLYQVYSQDKDNNIFQSK